MAWGAVAVLAVGAVVGAAAAWLLIGVDDAAPSATTSTIAPSTSPPAPTTVPPERLVGVDEVWLLDRQDGSYDWGLTVVTPPTVGRRSNVEVDVRLVAADGTIVHTANDTLDGVSATTPGALAGRVADLAPPPVRIEFDVSVGQPSIELSLGELLDVRAIDHDDDMLTGRVRSSAAEELLDLRLVLVWRSDGTDEADGERIPVGEVVATVVYDVDRLRPGVEARFELPLDRVVPDREPDDVFWVH